MNAAEVVLASAAQVAQGVVIVRNASMADFAGFLQARILDRPVVDQTGLSGRFDFRLQWKPEAQFLPLGMVLPQLSPETGAKARSVHSVSGTTGTQAGFWTNDGRSTRHRPRCEAL